MLFGDDEGIGVYNKLGNSQNPLDQAYFKRMFEAVTKYGSTYFSDVTEQRKGKLLNQKIFHLYFNKKDNKWCIDLFYTPDNSV